METFYFGPESHRLFGALHEPRGGACAGLIVCPPYGEEMVASYAHVTRWGKELVERGFAVLRHHPFGMGESDGTPADFSPQSALEDTVAAVRCLRERASVQRIGLMGLRFGGWVAAEAAAACQAEFLVLWSPVVNARQYYRDLLRLRLTKEMVHQHAEQVRVTSQGMIEELESGRSLDILGYDVSPEFYRQMNAARAWPECPPAPDVLWVSRPRECTPAAPLVESWRKHGGRVEFQALGEAAFWEDWEYGYPEKFATASTDWLAQRMECLTAAS